MSGPLRTWPTSANQDRCSQSSHSRHDHCLLTDSRCSATGSVIVFCRFHLTLLAVMIASSSAQESRRLFLLLLVSCSCRPSELGGNEVWLRDQSDVERQDKCSGVNALQAYGTTHQWWTWACFWHLDLQCQVGFHNWLLYTKLWHTSHVVVKILLSYTA